MTKSAAVTVLDHVPDDEEVEELAYFYLDDLDTDEAEATVDIVYQAPDWMNTCEQDQINAHMRDGGVCVVVVYMEYEENPAD